MSQYMNPIWLAFITGITTGGLSCLAVQGGLLASSVSHHEQSKKVPLVATFLLTKLAAYTLFGFLLGLLGSKLNFSPQFLGWMQIAAGIYMLIAVGNLLKLHPIFRYAVIQPPRFGYRLARNQSKTISLFAPAILGALTVFIPCGVTQAMMVMAVATGSPLMGALIMFAFTLGTSPIFAVMGLAAAKLLERKAFVYLASIVLLYLAFISINGGQVVRGSKHTAQNYWRVLVADSPIAEVRAAIGTQGKQEVTVQVSSNGYSTSANTIKAGVPVKLTLVSSNAQYI